MEHVMGNIFIRPNKLEKKGDQVHGHKHNFDHVTYFYKGSFHVKAVLPSGQVVDRDFKTGDYILIKKEVEHEITALEDNSEFHCIYAHRTPQGDVVQEYTGYERAYQ